MGFIDGEEFGLELFQCGLEGCGKKALGGDVEQARKAVADLAEDAALL